MKVATYQYERSFFYFKIKPSDSVFFKVQASSTFFGYSKFSISTFQATKNESLFFTSTHCLLCHFDNLSAVMFDKSLRLKLNLLHSKRYNVEITLMKQYFFQNFYFMFHLILYRVELSLCFEFHFFFETFNGISFRRFYQY